MKHGREEINKEIANDSTYNIHHKGEGNKGAEYTH